jgi:hypothetical protein
VYIYADLLVLQASRIHRTPSLLTESSTISKLGFIPTIMRHSFAAWSFTGFALGASALTPAQWRGQSVYQVLTDRFARSDGSTTATCNTGSQIYCGGTWQGIIQKLDYIQNMGFTAVSSPTLIEVGLAHDVNRSGYLQSWRMCPRTLATARATMGIGPRTSTRLIRTLAKRRTWWHCPRLYMRGEWYVHIL